MLTRHKLTLAGVAAGTSVLLATAVAATPSGGTAASPAGDPRPSTLATASGGAAAPALLPTLVATHHDRAEAALGRAGTAADQSKPAVAGSELATAQARTASAWTAAQWIVKTTPPAPPVDDRAGVSGDAPTGLTYADPPTTAGAVLVLQHDVIGAAAGVLATTPAASARAIATIKAVGTARAAAIEHIHQVAPPAPPADDRSQARGAPVGGATFDTVMSGLLPVLDDEIQALKGTRKLTKGLPATAQTALKAAITRAKGAKAKINAYWPPLPADD